MGEGEGSFAAWFKQNKEKYIAEGVIPKPEDVFQSIYSYTKPGISIVPKPRCEKEIWDESKQGDRTELIRKYLQAVEEVRKNKRIPTEEKLKKRLPPLVTLCDITFPPGYEFRLKFIAEDIDLKEELDIENLINNSEKYTIVENTELKELGILRVNNKNLWLAEKYADDLCNQWTPISEGKEYSAQDEQTTLDNAMDIEQLLPYIEPLPQYYSVSDIYELWLPTLTPEKMKSNDLLDRILVAYTIKRALNQDEKAINKLVNLFQMKAEAVAVKMAKKRGLLKRCEDGVKAEAIYLLWLAIGGYPPKLILDGLNGNFDIPKSVETFYLYWLSKEVPERLNEYPSIDPFDVLVLLNPASPIASETRWKLSQKAIHMFNSLSFRPSRGTNLYTWLFGTDKNPMQGRFCQGISDYLDEFTIKQKKVDNQYVIEPEDYEDEIRHTQVDRQRRYFKGKKPVRHDENNPDENYIDDRARVGDSVPVSKEDSYDERAFEVMIDKYKPVLIKYGISERDAIIVLSCLSGEYTNDAMAKQHNLHKRSIEQIICRCKPVLKEILQKEV